MVIMQGDQYSIPFEITREGEPVTEEMVSCVEITIGSLCKIAGYNNGAFYFPISQEETFAMCVGNVKVQVRVEFVTGDIIGCRCEPIEVISSISNTVM